MSKDKKDKKEKKEKKGQEEIQPIPRDRETPGDKDKPSRVARQQQKTSKRKRRIILVVLLLVVAVLAAGAIFNIPYINIVREAAAWVGDKLSGESATEEPQPTYLFTTNPQTGREMEGDISVLVALYKRNGGDDQQREILHLSLFTYDPAGGAGEIFLIPEACVAYNVAGQGIPLSQALREQGGEDLLRSTVGNMTGSEVDYLLLLDFWDAVRAIQGTGFPPHTLDEETVLINPTNGETNFLVSGQQVRDADRLLCWLLVTDSQERWEAYAGRLERARAYLPEAFSGLAAGEPDGLEEGLASLQAEDLLKPATGSAVGDRSYLASMLQALAELDEGELLFKAVPAVEVLNGCGFPDLGKKVGERINSLGLPVAGTGGNAKVVVDGEEVNDFSHETSSIIYRSQDERVEAYARYLGVLLSIEDVRFEPGPGVEVVLIAGKDLAQ